MITVVCMCAYTFCNYNKDIVKRLKLFPITIRQYTSDIYRTTHIKNNTWQSIDGLHSTVHHYTNYGSRSSIDYIGSYSRLKGFLLAEAVQSAAAGGNGGRVERHGTSQLTLVLIIRKLLTMHTFVGTGNPALLVHLLNCCRVMSQIEGKWYTHVLHSCNIVVWKNTLICERIKFNINCCYDFSCTVGSYYWCFR